MPVLLASLLLGGCTERPTLAGSFDLPAVDAGRVLKVSGTGRMSLPPSQASFECVIKLTAPTAEAAWAQGSARMAKLSKVLEQAGVRPTDMVMRDIQLVLQGADRPDAWWLGQRMVVTVNELQRLPALLAVVLGAGADAIEQMRFGITDMRGAGDRARERALIEARTKAEMLAQEVSLRLGAVRSIEESQLSPDSVEGSPEAPPGSFEVVSRIEVTYELLD